jgi:hypothetical protein
LQRKKEKGRRGNLGEEETDVVQNEEIRRRGAGEGDGGGGPRQLAEKKRARSSRARLWRWRQGRRGGFFSPPKGYAGQVRKEEGSAG